MPINSDTFNSRVTSETLERKFRQTFPAQAGAELIQDLYAQGTIVPIVDFTDAATGSVLRSDLQTARNEATDRVTLRTADAGTSKTLQSTAGFYQVLVTGNMKVDGTNAQSATFEINDGTSDTLIDIVNATNGLAGEIFFIQKEFVVFLKAGSSLETTLSTSFIGSLDVYSHQIADVYGTLTNPLGFVSQ